MPFPERQILTLLESYLPGYKAGGPIRSVGNLVAALHGEFQFKIVTLNHDLGEKVPFPGIVANRWVRVGHAEVMYLRPGPQGLFRMFALLRSVDRNTVLYLNSFYARRFSMLAILMVWLRACRLRCVLLAPRGEFSPGAMLFKPRRKLWYTRISRSLGLYRSVIWHASSRLEAADIRRQFPLTKHIGIAGVIPDCNASDGEKWNSVKTVESNVAAIACPSPRARLPKRSGALRAVFVSRVSRMKNVAGALRMLEAVSGDVSFEIYGPVEDAVYWEECQALIEMLPTNIRVRYQGEIEHEKVGQVFAECELFLFPTLGESFGHAIFEALASGCPVLISDQTQWRNLEAEGVGWDIPLGEMSRFRSVLQQCVDGDEEWHAALSRRAGNYAARRASDPETIDANRKLFQRAFAWANPHGSATDL